MDDRTNPLNYEKWKYMVYNSKYKDLLFQTKDSTSTTINSDEEKKYVKKIIQDYKCLSGSSTEGKALVKNFADFFYCQEIQPGYSNRFLTDYDIAEKKLSEGDFFPV